MINNTGYYKSLHDDMYIEAARPLLVTSCGHYKLIQIDQLVTRREYGRQDWLIIYIADGCGHFKTGNNWQILKKGTCLLFHPDQPQDYYYLLSDHPDIYWIHFSGTHIEPLLTDTPLPRAHHFQIGTDSRYNDLFERIIHEIQLRTPGFEQICSALFLEFLVMAGRSAQRLLNTELTKDDIIYRIIEDFHLNFTQELPVEYYAQKYNMSTCWFIRKFKSVTTLSPQQFIIQLRIQKAKELFEQTSLNITEISQLIGYQNPLYFSRIFKKHTGMSPSDYKKALHQNKQTHF